MVWIFTISLIANIALIYWVISRRKQLKKYDQSIRQLTGQLNQMKKIIHGYENIIVKEREQLQYILINFLRREEIMALKERAIWLEELQKRLKQHIEREQQEEKIKVDGIVVTDEGHMQDVEE